MAHHFATLLRTTRQESGFHSAYAFYHDNGGRRVFPFSYPYYSRIEHGRALPRPTWLPILLSSLRVPPVASIQRDFVAAYLRDIFGDDDLFEDIVAPWFRPPASLSIPKKALRRLLGGQTHNLTIEQHDAIVSSPSAFWSFFCLTKNREPLVLEDLRKLTELPVAGLQAGLRRLIAAKLVKKASGGKYFSPLWERFSFFPRSGKGHEERMQLSKEYIDEAADKRGGTLMLRTAIVRAEESDMLSLAQSIHETVECAHGCATEDPGHRTAMFVVEASVKKIFPF
jgi:hypothetical protein